MGRDGRTDRRTNEETRNSEALFSTTRTRLQILTHVDLYNRHHVTVTATATFACHFVSFLYQLAVLTCKLCRSEWWQNTGIFRRQRTRIKPLGMLLEKRELTVVVTVQMYTRIQSETGYELKDIGSKPLVQHFICSKCQRQTLINNWN